MPFNYFLPAVAVSWFILLLIVWHRQIPRWVGIGLMGLYLVFVVGSVTLGMRT